ncbi:MAG TPA: PspA/IM30 family protein [Ktedonobacteraceae bacterium]|nr:PspA/IM30 family protein [Ktedonobacteraceae bacterium]
MNLLERVLTLLRANLNTMAEKSEDPEKMLRQLQQDMRNQLVQVKTQVATAISEEMKLQKRSKGFQTDADLWLKKAEQAVQQNNENAARDYLARYNDLIRQAQRYEQQRKEQEQLVSTMRGILRQLEAKISEVDTTIELLAARKRSALLQQRVYDTLSKSGSPKDKESANRAQDKLLEIEARARALADLQQHDLDAQLARISQEQVIENQLQQLKQKKLQRPEKPRLLKNKPTTGELVPPDALDSSEPAQKRPAHLPNTGELAPTTPEEPTNLDLERLKRLMGM